MQIKKYTQKDRYGNSMSFEFEVPPMDGGGAPPHPGQAVGTDTVPAMLTPGEFVMNAEATRMFQPQIEAMNEQGRAVQQQQGGTIPSNVPPTPANQTVQHRNAGGHITGGGFGIPGMVGGLPTMDPMQGARMPNTQTAMDNMMRPQVPQVAPQFFNQGGIALPQSDGIYDDVSLGNMWDSLTDYMGFNDPAPQGAPARKPAPRMQKKTPRPAGTVAERPQTSGQMGANRIDPSKVGTGAKPQPTGGRMQQGREAPIGMTPELERTGFMDKPGGNIFDNKEPGEGSLPEDKVVSAERGEMDKQMFLEEQIAATQADADADEKKYSGRGDLGMKTPEDRAKIFEERGKVIKDKNPSAFDKIFNTLKKSAMGLFDDEELGRAAILYLGNRALGYSHGGSLNWTAKQYLQRVDAKAAAHSKRVQGLLDSGEYTKASVAKYKESRNINDLEEVGLTYTPTGKTEFRMVPVKGKNGKWTMQRAQLREVKGSDGGIYFQNLKGERVDPMLTMPHQPENDPNMPEYGAKNQRVAEYLKGTMESKLKLLDGEKGFGGKDQPNRPIGFTADDASKQFVSFARSLGLDPDSEYVQAMASNALAQAYGDAAKGIKATTYIPYLTQQFIREETGTKEHLKTGEDKDGRPIYVEADLIAKLNAEMVAAATQRRKKAKLPDMSSTQIRQTIYNSAMDSWGDLSDAEKKQYERMATSGKTTAFYEYMVNNLADFRTFK